MKASRAPSDPAVEDHRSARREDLGSWIAARGLDSSLAELPLSAPQVFIIVTKSNKSSKSNNSSNSSNNITIIIKLRFCAKPKIQYVYVWGNLKP